MHMYVCAYICIFTLLYLYTECIKIITNNNAISGTTITTSSVTHTTTNTTIETASIVTSSPVDVTTPTTVQITRSQKNSAGVEKMISCSY